METEVRTEWLSNRDAEKLTSLSRTTLWRLARVGEIKVARVGRAVRINRRSLEEYLERTVDATSRREDC
jgi:excisionase family DNA binding protein